MSIGDSDRPGAASARASFPAGATAVGGILDGLAESFDSVHVAVSASEDGDGRWAVSLDFHDPPNQTAVKAVVALVAGAESANALVFETIAATDWVAASLAGLSPVAAGRFMVHGAHDRGRSRPTASASRSRPRWPSGPAITAPPRGCLMALDRIAKRLKAGTGSAALAPDAFSISAPAAASSPSRPRAHCGVPCWPATTIRARSGPRGPMRGSTGRARIEVIHAAGLANRRFRARAPFDLVLANILLDL